MRVEIWSVGKPNEPFMDGAITHYLQKTGPYNPVELVILPPSKKAGSDPTRNKAAEGEIILKRLQPQHYLLLLDERGRELDSLQWADGFRQLMNSSTKTLVLLIGGAFGVSEEVRQRARQTWSLSRLVFPHQLVRLIVAEQVYRAFSILNNSPYHHI